MQFYFIQWINKITIIINSYDIDSKKSKFTTIAQK